MVNRDLVAAKLADLSDRVSRVRLHCPREPAELAANRDALDLVSFNLMLAVQTCADIASHLIADEGWPAAQSLADGFQRLAEKGVISSTSAGVLSRAVGLRNVVAHGYAGVEATLVHAAATQGAIDLDTFAREVAGWLQGRSPA
jgi:uncharacterized protein YutE (UPF0331/DUF86 family)